jgi:hypothetical protein
MPRHSSTTLFAHSVPVYPHTLAVCTSLWLAWPRHSFPVLLNLNVPVNLGTHAHGCPGDQGTRPHVCRTLLGLAALPDYLLIA